MTELLDARGVLIEPGDTAIWGFGVGRAVAMGEGVVITRVPEHGPAVVSVTPSGRVRVRVVRRSYSDAEKPVIDVAADRLVVLKPVHYPDDEYSDAYTDVVLPLSPLPTQDDAARPKIQMRVDSYVEALRSTTPPSYWKREDGESLEAALARWYVYCTKQLAEERRKLKALDD